MNTEIQVLLIEEELDTLSVVSLSLAELKECRLNIQSNFTHALESILEQPPNLILFAHALQGTDSLTFLSEIHRKYPVIYTIVSLPQQHQEMSAIYVEAGVCDWIVKDKNYVSNLIAAVKNALTRIAERESVDLPQMVQADQLALEENLADVVFMLDGEGKFLHVNRAVGDLLEYEQNDVIQRHLGELLQSAGRIDFDNFIKSAKPGQKLRGTFSVRKGNGVIAEFEMNAAIQENGQIHGVLRKEEEWEFGDQAAEALSVGFGAALEETHAELIDIGEEEEASIPARLGPYRVVTMLGAGSMGRVYKGFDDQLDRPVAIKVISQALARDPDYLERFQKEARILASISHPNIALIYFLDRNHKPPFFCMEYMPGGSLEDLLQQAKKLDPELAVSYTMQVAIGLDEAYKRGIVHQDIKPSNLMIAENERLKIVDFGLARTSRELEEGPQMIAGTPLYIAPEQVQEGRTDFRSDIYSLGVTFFRMLYGRTPFAGGSLVEILYNQFHQGLPPRESLDQDVPPELYTIIQGMISTDLSRRYNSYSDLIQDLESARRSMMAEVVTEPIAAPQQAEIVLRGLLYDQPFAEVLGEILQKNLSGKLTLTWKDLYKNIFIENGKIVGVLSNQEGENFLELLLEKNRISPKKAREIGHKSIDLYLNYSTALSELSPEARTKLGSELHELSWKILNGLFSWLVGELIFEASQTPARMMIQIPLNEALVRGVKETADYNFIRRRLFWGKCRIRKSAEFQKNLMALKMKSADTFLLFRFEEQIAFSELFPITGIPEEEFYRLIYLFLCSDVVTLEEIQAETAPFRESAQRHVPPKISRVVEIPSAKIPEPPPPKPVEVKPEKEKPKPAAAEKPAEPVPKPKAGAAAKPSEPAQKPKPVSPKAPIVFPPPEPGPAAPDPLAAKLQSNPNEMAKYYYNCALDSFNQKNYWGTVEYCNKSLEHKKDPRVFRLMGNAFATHPKFRGEAMEAYKKALEFDPENPQTIRDIADLYYSTGSKSLAKARYQDVLSIDPDNSHATRRLTELKDVKK
jgi:PAS domain S-box-containing protein